MKNSLLLIFLLSFVSLNAQEWKPYGAQGDIVKPYYRPPVIDRSVLECVYSHKEYDPYFDKTEEKFYILEAGINRSKYSSYPTYRVDSIIEKDYSNQISRNRYANLRRECSVYRQTPTCVKDCENNKLSYKRALLMDIYVYTESIPDFNWKLVAGIDTICGQVCHKATCDFRGRSWEAWYSNIPNPNGPWKFHGLPGLIMKVVDSKGDHVFEAVALRQSDKDIRYGQSKSTFITKRKQFNVMCNRYMTDEQQNLSEFAEVKNADGSEMVLKTRRRHYNPIEISDLE